jgi:hypothetical protein
MAVADRPGGRRHLGAVLTAGRATCTGSPSSPGSCTVRRVSQDEGHYEHGGVRVKWNEKRVKLFRDEVPQRVKWRDVSGVRRIGSLPGHVQLIVEGHVPHKDPEKDPLSIPVASEADGNRLLTMFSWLAASRTAS